jgi:hypothetical protein
LISLSSGDERAVFFGLAGALIFGGSVIAATVFYFTQKKKVGSYKPV